MFYDFFSHQKLKELDTYSSPVFSEMKMRMIDSMFLRKEKLLTKLYSLPLQTHIKFTLKVEINFTAVLIWFLCMFSFGKLDEFSYNLLFLYCPSLRLLFHQPLFNLTLQKIFCGKKKLFSTLKFSFLMNPDLQKHNCFCILQEKKCRYSLISVLNAFIYYIDLKF